MIHVIQLVSIFRICEKIAVESLVIFNHIVLCLRFRWNVIGRLVILPFNFISIIQIRENCKWQNYKSAGYTQTPMRTEKELVKRQEYVIVLGKY